MLTTSTTTGLGGAFTGTYGADGELVNQLYPNGINAGYVRAGASALAFGERFGGARLAGMALVLAGIAVIVLPVRRGHASTPESS